MNKKNPYQNFQKYILRTPLLPFNLYKELTSEKKIKNKDFKIFCSNPIIIEAVFLASPALFEEMNKWLKNEINDDEKESKLKISILKYISRMSSRCTPFGLFAGCSLGVFEDETDIKLKPADKTKRHTRLDMNFLVALAQDLTKNKKIKKQLLFYPNSSLYKISNNLRYIEYKYINGKRNHQIVSVNNTKYLQTILSASSKGLKLLDMAKLLVDDEIKMDEAYEYIEELVSSQLLVSELEPSVSGPEFLDQIYSVLNNIADVDEILSKLNIVNQKIKKIDTTVGNSPLKYIQISDSLKKLNTHFESKFLFQTDLILNNESNTINKNIINDIKKGFLLLNKISTSPKSSILTEFKEAFYERFEDREVPLSKALDVELGVGYKQNIGAGDVNPLIDNIVIPPSQKKDVVNEIKWSYLHTLFHNKLQKAIKDGDYIITITDDDLKDYDFRWEDFPDTISSFIELVLEKGIQKVKYNGFVGSSGANLLGRFCHGDTAIDSYVKEIIDIETHINKDKILAEIVHLPESRVGNILMRPEFRSFEIPYLAKSIKNTKYQIPIDDIMISIPAKGKILLRSKKFNKEIVPRLTNAHNFSNNSLPIYHFLSDMQTQGLRKGIGLDLGPLNEIHEFIPRIEYKNLILQEAKWNLQKRHIEPLLKNIDSDDDKLYKLTSEVILKLKIPKFVVLAEGDNELIINFNNITSIRMFIDSVKKRNNFVLKEFLHADNGIVKSDKNYYTNQVIVSFYNKDKLDKHKLTD